MRSFYSMDNAIKGIIYFKEITYKKSFLFFPQVLYYFFLPVKFDVFLGTETCMTETKYKSFQEMVRAGVHFQ